MGGVFGGDSSVEWIVTGDNVRKATHTDHEPKRSKPRGVTQTGTDETANGEEFTTSIEVPSGSAGQTFLDQLHNAKNVGGRVKFTLPIQQRHREQIKIDWISDPRRRRRKRSRRARP